MSTNPYLICEQDQGDRSSEPISLEVIDRGVRPEGHAGLFIQAQEQIAQDHSRRVRAVMHSVLSDAAQAGDTLLPLDEALRLVQKRFPARRACSADRELVIEQADLYDESLQLLPDSEPPLVALKHLADLEDSVRRVLSRRVSKTNPDVPINFDWNPLLDLAVGAGKGTVLGDDAEKRARAEKIRALNVLFARRFSVLTGGAGTGKTSVLAALLDGIKELEGRRQ